MLDDEVKDSERLYSAIKISIPHVWKKDVNRPSSAAFKDSKGVSVDREGERKVKSGTTH